MITWEDVLAIGRELPETEESTSYGRPSLKVRGKSFVTIRERPDALVVRCDGEEKPFLLEGRPDLVFTTPHYDGYPICSFGSTRRSKRCVSSCSTRGCCSRRRGSPRRSWTNSRWSA